MKITVAIAAVVVAMPAMAMPSWARSDTQRRDGDQYQVVCAGSGPAIDLARRDAMAQCDAAASRQIQADVKVTTLSVETERDASVHEEIAVERVLRGLTCVPQRESIEERDGVTHLWVRCRYDLSKVEVRDVPKVPPSSASNASLGVARHSQGAEVATDEVSERNTISVATVPRCSEIILRGAKPRTVQCARNPVSLVVEPGDTQAIVRADKFEPKTIDLRSLKVGEAINVMLEPMD